jgi:allantoin racemase
MIAHRFSIITMPRRTMEQSDRVLRSVGLEHRCTVRAVDVPVTEVEHGSAHLLEIFAENARAAIEEDGAEAIILGCAGLTELVAPLQDLIGVPVIDGVCAAVKLAEALVAQGLSSSRIATYAPSPESAGIRVTWS